MIKLLLVDVPEDVDENSISIVVNYPDTSKIYQGSQLKNMPTYKVAPFTNSTFITGVCTGYNDCIKDILNKYNII